MLYHLAYVSKATYLMTNQELIDLLAQAQRNNMENDVTGLLLYKDQSFIEVLEGPQLAVEETYSRICKDTRHAQLKTLFKEPIVSRDFPSWAMGFRNLDDPEILTTPGFTNFMLDEYPIREFAKDLSRARKLLLFFRARS